MSDVVRERAKERRLLAIFGMACIILGCVLMLVGGADGDGPPAEFEADSPLLKFTFSGRGIGTLLIATGAVILLTLALKGGRETTEVTGDASGDERRRHTVALHEKPDEAEHPREPEVRTSGTIRMIEPRPGDYPENHPNRPITGRDSTSDTRRQL